jgi:hypothetical protein
LKPARKPKPILRTPGDPCPLCRATLIPRAGRAAGLANSDPVAWCEPCRAAWPIPERKPGRAV